MCDNIIYEIARSPRISRIVCTAIARKSRLARRTVVASERARGKRVIILCRFSESIVTVTLEKRQKKRNVERRKERAFAAVMQCARLKQLLGFLGVDMQ